mmetsp:Transcript_27475/g.42009  ORF Transcript_27475/g.42009 Transcript_27475/m.42009 type:complete len:485 (-) Transcript_27475:1028-2482(-)
MFLQILMGRPWCFREHHSSPKIPKLTTTRFLVLQMCLVSILWQPKYYTTHGYQQPKRRIAVIGGGASGMFSAIAAADAIPPKQKRHTEVIVFEASPSTLTKVSISGGGRCNVLHDTTKSIPEILGGYPRGKKELTGLMNKRFTPTQAKEWFTSRGVQLKTEPDGRMFPVTDSSQTIIDCITDAAIDAGVQICKYEKVKAISSVCEIDGGDDDSTANPKFCVSIQHKKEVREEEFDSVILATGSSPIGHEMASSLGHSIVQPVPSLFTLNAKLQVKEGGVLHGLSGVSVKFAKVEFKYAVPNQKKKKALLQEGPLLITHHGISGPATLRLSAFGARQFKDINYQGDVKVHWAPELGTSDEIFEALWKLTLVSGRTVSSACPLQLQDGSSPIPRRLWSSLVEDSGIGKERKWAEAPKKQVRKLALNISEFMVHTTGKGVFKDEFVTAGGVKLKEINMNTMQSKKCPGLFLCGEVIDIDSVTGGSIL